MTINIGESIIVLIPTSALKEEQLIWDALLCSDVKSTPIQFTKNSYLGYTGIVNTNPMLSNVKNGMHLPDYVSGFNSHNYGCSINFDTESSSISILITWYMIMAGITTGIKVWRNGAIYTMGHPAT